MCTLLMNFYAISSKWIFILIHLCSEEEAKKKIYSVCTTTYTGFGALISEELSYKVKGDNFMALLFCKILSQNQVWTELCIIDVSASLGLPGVLWVLPDSYLDVPNKDYGG